MNVLDLFIVLALIGAGFGGYRLGFVTRAFSWIGISLGLLLAVRLLPSILHSRAGIAHTKLFLIALGILAGCGFLGQLLGLLVGSKIHLALPTPKLRHVDEIAGAVMACIGVVVTVWLFTPVMATVPGWPAREARTSAVAKGVHTVLPDPPDTLSTLRRLVGKDGFPEVFNALQPAPNVGKAPAETGLSTKAALDATAATVLVEGLACRNVQDGTGVVLGIDTVVTNAHVVAGERTTEVITAQGTHRPAVVIAFDSDRDLAVLHVTDLGLSPLKLGNTEETAQGGIFGHPGGGPLRVAPFRIARVVDANGRNLYDSADARRNVAILATRLAPGDSGSALVSSSGEVVGIAFAIAPDQPGVAYAVTTTEVRKVLDSARTEPVGTGPCLA